MPDNCPPNMGECLLNKLAHRMSFASRQNIIVRFLLLQDQPHPFGIVTRMAPVSFGIKVTEKQPVQKVLAFRYLGVQRPCATSASYSCGVLPVLARFEIS
jgi:hypothetical protein